MGKRFGLLVMSCLVLGLVACKSDEADDLARAQDCLDHVSPNNPTDAGKCLQYVKDYNSQQANIIRCSIYMTAGGLVESKVVSAYNFLKSTSGLTANNNSALFYSVLALDKPNKADGLKNAQLGDVYCQKTGISSLITISSYIVVGSTLSNLLGETDPNNPNIADPTTTEGQTELNNQIQSCASDPWQTKCSPSVVGPAVVAIADSYCATDAADAKICDEIQGAVAGGSTPTEVGNAVYCYLNNQKYNPTTALCF